MLKESFAFKRTWAEAMAGLPDQVRLEVYDAVVRYGTTGKLSDLKAMAGTAFEFIKQDIDRQLQHSDRISKIRAQVASKRKQTTGKPQQVSSKEKQTASKEKQPSSKPQQTPSKEKQTVSKTQQASSKEKQAASKTQQAPSKEKQTSSQPQQALSKEKQAPSKENFAGVCKQNKQMHVLQPFANKTEQNEQLLESSENEPFTSHARIAGSIESIESINSIDSIKSIDSINSINKNKNKENAQKKEKEKQAAFPGADIGAAGANSRAATGNNKATSNDAAPTTNINARAFITYFCSTMEAAKAVIPHRCAYTERRAKAIRLRCQEYGKEAMKRMVDKAAKSDFLNGRSSCSWMANLDWLLRPNNFVKVVEGNYDNITPINSTGYENSNKRKRDMQTTYAIYHDAADYEE